MVFNAQAVLFDFDGVLVDSTPTVIRNWDDFAARHGVGPGDPVLHEHGLRAIEKIQAFRDKHGLDFSVETETQWFNQLEVDTAVDLVTFPGAAEILKALPSDRWAIYTACVLDLVLARLKASKLPIPRVIVPAEDVSRGKPDPEGYITAARLLGVAPENCVVIEDAPSGVTAGLRAGAKVIAVATTHMPEQLTHANVVVSQLADLRVSVDNNGITLLAENG